MSYSLKTESFSNHVSFSSKRIIKCLTTVLFADLGRLIDCFTVYSNSIGEVRILRVIAIKIAHSLLIKTSLLPSSDEL